MLNIVTELLARRVEDLEQDQTLTTVLVLKNPNKNAKKGAPKGRIELRITRLNEASVAVRSALETPWGDSSKEAVAVPTNAVATKLQKLLTPLRLLGFEAGSVWTIA